jgi:flagellin-like protein
MRKGLSPLVAAVILIAVTMTIAGILSYWVSTFVRRLPPPENATENIMCLDAQFRFYSGSYDSDDEELILVLENQRSLDLELNGLYLFDENDMLTDEKTLTGTLKGNRLKSFNVTGVDVFTKGIIKTNCPEVSVGFTYDQVT